MTALPSGKKELTSRCFTWIKATGHQTALGAQGSRSRKERYRLARIDDESTQDRN